MSKDRFEGLKWVSAQKIADESGWPVKLVLGVFDRIGVCSPVATDLASLICDALASGEIADGRKIGDAVAAYVEREHTRACFNWAAQQRQAQWAAPKPSMEERVAELESSVETLARSLVRHDTTMRAMQQRLYADKALRDAMPKCDVGSVFDSHDERISDIESYLHACESVRDRFSKEDGR